MKPYPPPAGSEAPVLGLNVNKPQFCAAICQGRGWATAQPGSTVTPVAGAGAQPPRWGQCPQLLAGPSAASGGGGGPDQALALPSGFSCVHLSSVSCNRRSEASELAPVSRLLPKQGSERGRSISWEEKTADLVSLLTLGGLEVNWESTLRHAMDAPSHHTQPAGHELQDRGAGWGVPALAPSILCSLSTSPSWQCSLHLPRGLRHVRNIRLRLAM